jgi:hypothetical protein
MQRLKDKFNTIEGVEKVALARVAPFAMDRSGFRVSVFDENADDQQATPQMLKSYNYTPIDQDYLGALDIQLLKGRNITFEDRDYLAPVVINNEASAKVFFPGKEALNQPPCRRLSRVVDC